MRVKATAFVLLLVSAALCVAGAASIWQTDRLLEREQMLSTKSLAEGLARTAAVPLATNEPDVLEVSLQRFDEDPNILFYATYDRHNKLFVRSVQDQAAWRRYTAGEWFGPSSFVASAVVTSARLPEQLRWENLDPTAEETEEQVPSNVLGRVVVARSSAGMRAARASHIKTTLAVLVLAVLVIVPLVLWIVGKWTRRLDAVVAASEQIARGDLSQTLWDLRSGDEVGRLCRAYERMRRALHERDRKMRGIQETLEQQVAQRTQDLAEARDRAQGANQAKTQFLANMSHELRTPMHGILSFAGFGCNRLHTAPREKLGTYFERIDQSARRLLLLLNELLDLAKLESGSTKLDRASTNLGKLVQVGMEEVDALLKDRKVSIDFAPTVTVECDIDGGKILQVIRNLLSNAIKFSPEGSTIEVTLFVKQQLVRVTVADRGIGIPDHELEAVFDKFVQSTKSKNGAGGTGLGLAICREIVSLHDGRIWADNRPDGGAAFSFELPLGRDQAGSRATSEGLASPARA